MKCYNKIFEQSGYSRANYESLTAKDPWKTIQIFLLNILSTVNTQPGVTLSLRPKTNFKVHFSSRYHANRTHTYQVS